MDSQENNEISESATGDGNEDKNPKYTAQQQQPVLPRFNSTGPFIGFEDEESLTPTYTPPRSYTSLDLDSRFFPDGLKTGQIVEVKGPENCGKTFLLSYFLVHLLRSSPLKKAVMIDTSHQFCMRNLLSLLCHEKPYDKTKDKSLSVSQILETTPELEPYLDRLIFIQCHTVEEFLLTVVHEEHSLLNKIIKEDPEIALVVVDTVDCYSFTKSRDRNDPIEVLAGLKKNCYRVPVICSTIRLPSTFQMLDKNALPESEPGRERPWYSNVTIDPTLFTNTLTIVPGTAEEKAMLPPDLAPKTSHFATAYLRSKQRANIAGSAEIHRVKFSIFSDMLWVVS